MPDFHTKKYNSEDIYSDPGKNVLVTIIANGTFAGM